MVAASCALGCGGDCGCACGGGKPAAVGAAVTARLDPAFQPFVDAASGVLPFTPLAPFAPFVSSFATHPGGGGGGGASPADEARYGTLAARWQTLQAAPGALHVPAVGSALASWQGFASAWSAGLKQTGELGRQEALLAAAEREQAAARKRVKLQVAKPKRRKALVVGLVGVGLVGVGLVVKAVL